MVEPCSAHQLIGCQSSQWHPGNTTVWKQPDPSFALGNLWAEVRPIGLQGKSVLRPEEPVAAFHRSSWINFRVCPVEERRS